MTVESFTDEEGFVHMCRQCQRVKDLINNDWVLYTSWYVDPPENTKWQLCPNCK